MTLCYNLGMKDFLISLLDWIYKKKCYFCRSSKECVKMCSECYNELSHLALAPQRIVEGKKVFCAGIYSKHLQKLIRGLKYHNQRDLAYFLARFMYDYWLQITESNQFEVVPVPIFPKREKQRKYNHMNLVAEEFSKLTGNEVNTNLIKRIRNTKPQYNLKRHERIQNLANAFVVNKEYYKGKTIMLLDDICTTGTTFEEMIKELQKVGITDIVCFAATTPFGE